MLDDIYNRRILELAADIPRLGRLASPGASATAHSKLCGSTVTVDVTVSDGVVSDFAHDVKACALGQASSSIMARHVIGATPDELRSLREDVRRMLKEKQHLISVTAACSFGVFKVQVVNIAFCVLSNAIVRKLSQ